MCNVIHLLFACDHLLKVRRSQCKGTRHKITRTSIRAACAAESFLTLNIQSDCSSCEHRTWESGWISKLARAATFLAKLREKRLPGANEVSALVEDLETKYQAASWDARHMASHAFKKSVTRVGVTHHTTARSPLQQELHPEDVVDAGRKKQWTDMKEQDYDGGYIASTDPIHPVHTDYSHPWDDDNGAWILNHLSAEELASQNEDVSLDLDHHHWNWDTDAHANNFSSEPAHWSTGTNALIASSSLAQAHEEAVREDQIQQVIQAFWEVVNNTANTTNNTSTDTNRPDADQGPHNLTPFLQNLDMTPTTRPTTPPSQASHWTDGPSDAWPPAPPSTCPPSSPLSPALPKSPNSTRASFDKQRRYLKRRLQGDGNQAGYCSHWLLVSRWEARAFEGPEGRFVPDPQMPGLAVSRGHRGNGWFK